MSDQNRLLLAAALMAVVLFVSWQFMGKQNQDQQQAVQVHPVAQVTQPQASVQSPGESIEENAADSLSDQLNTADSSSVQDSSLVQVPEYDERNITVIIRDNNNKDMVTAEISSITGSIVDWRLDQYEDKPGADTGTMVDFNGVQWFNGEQGYTCDSPDTVIVEGEESKTISFDNIDEGRQVVYTFTPGFYGFEIARAGSDQVLTLNEGVLPVSETNATMRNYFKAQWNAEKVKSRNSSDIQNVDQVGNVRWISARSKYFGIILMPESFERAYGFVYAGSEDTSPSIGLQDDVVMVYAGPLDYGILRSLGSDTQRMVDFGWPVIRDIGRLLFWFCNSVLGFLGNWGVRIIVLSIVLKLVLLPISTKSFRSMAKLKQVQPKMKELQDKYRNDPKALQAAMQKLYREEGVNPLGGCLPLLMQMPVFFAMYRVLANSVQLRGAPFILWVKDLSNPEIFISFQNPILGLNGIGLLAVMMGVSMFLQQRMSTVDQSQKGMMYILPIFMTFLFMRFPAGLTLYWFMNNILTIIQQVMINKSLETGKA